MMSSGAAPSAKLTVEVGNQSVLCALDDVVAQTLIEREIGGFLLLSFGRAAEVLGDGGDMKLIDRHLLFTRLLPPISGRNVGASAAVGGC